MRHRLRSEDRPVGTHPEPGLAIRARLLELDLIPLAVGRLDQVRILDLPRAVLRRAHGIEHRGGQRAHPHLGPRLQPVAVRIEAQFAHRASVDDLHLVDAPLELRIDELSGRVRPITKFTIPGGNLCVSHCHVCRTVCRRAERAALRADEAYGVSHSALVYLNRLSDYFYILGRALNEHFKVEEILWKP